MELIVLLFNSLSLIFALIIVFSGQNYAFLKVLMTLLIIIVFIVGMVMFIKG